MATEKRYIDAKSAKKHFLKVGQPAEYKGVIHWVVPCSEIDKIPTVDAVEVVRCKDCKYRIHDDVTNEWFCNSWYSGFVYAKPNDFCSYGERMCPDE